MSIINIQPAGHLFVADHESAIVVGGTTAIHTQLFAEISPNRLVKKCPNDCCKWAGVQKSPPNLKSLVFVRAVISMDFLLLLIAVYLWALGNKQLVQNRMNRLVGQLLSFLSSRITLQ
jgi:hypothetical protein